VFIKEMIACEKVISDTFKANYLKDSIVKQAMITKVRAYLGYTLKQEIILEGVHGI